MTLRDRIALRLFRAAQAIALDCHAHAPSTVTAALADRFGAEAARIVARNRAVPAAANRAQPGFDSLN